MRTRTVRVAVTTVLVCLPLLPFAASASDKCATLIVGKDATADGSVLIARTEDLGYNSAWGAFRKLMLKVHRHYCATIGTVRERWDAFEAREFARQAAVEGRALALYATDPDAAREYLTRHSNRRAVSAYETALELFEEIKDTS